MTSSMAGRLRQLAVSTKSKRVILFFHLRRFRASCNVQGMDSIPPRFDPNPPPRRTGWIVYAVIASFFLFLSVLANLVLFGLTFGGGGREKLTLASHKSRYEEH